MFQEIEDGNLEEVKELLDKGAKFDLRDLKLACDNNNLEIVKLLLNKRANIIKEKDYEGDTILSFVCFNPKIKKEIVKLLLDKGADIENKNNYGVSPLMGAIKNNTEIAELLLDKGANIEARDKDGYTLLLYYCGSDSGIKRVKFLLDKGADIEAKDKDGNTPLLLACSNTNTSDNAEEIVKLLLEKKANMKVINKYGDNVFTLAHNNFNRRILTEVIENYYVKYLENKPKPEKIFFFSDFFKILGNKHNSVLLEDMKSKYGNFFDDYFKIFKTDANYTNMPTATKNKRTRTFRITLRKPPPPNAIPIPIATDVVRDPETEGFDVSDPDIEGELLTKRNGGKKKSIKRKTKKIRRKTSKR